MSKKTLLFLFLAAFLGVSCATPSRIIWTEGETDPDSGKATHTLEIVNPPAGADWTLWFSQFRTPVQVLEGEGSIEHLGGTLYRVAPGKDRGKGNLVLRYEARPLANQCRAPEGFYLQKKGGNPSRWRPPMFSSPPNRLPDSNGTMWT